MHRRLQGANQNYGGHRQKALEHIRAVLGTATPPPIGTRTGQVNLPQPASDAILRDARTSLEKIRDQLPAGAVTGSGNGDPREAVDKAIRELERALADR